MALPWPAASSWQHRHRRRPPAHNRHRTRILKCRQRRLKVGKGKGKREKADVMSRSFATQSKPDEDEFAKNLTNLCSPSIKAASSSSCSQQITKYTEERVDSNEYTRLI